MQWRSHGHSFGGGGTPSAEGASHSKGSGADLPFPGEILQKKILLLRITHSHRPPSISPRISSFYKGDLQLIGGLSPPPLPPLSTPLYVCEKSAHSLLKAIYFQHV